MAFGGSICLPGDCWATHPGLCSGSVGAEESTSYASSLRHRMASASFSSPSWHGNTNSGAKPDPSLETHTHIFVPVPPIQSPLQRHYRGLFHVLDLTDMIFIVLKDDGSEESISKDCLKLAFLEADVLFVGGNEPPPCATRSGRIIRTGKCYKIKSIEQLNFAGIPCSDAERFALEVCASCPLPLLDGPEEFPDDELCIGPPISLEP